MNADNKQNTENPEMNNPSLPDRSTTQASRASRRGFLQLSMGTGVASAVAGAVVTAPRAARADDYVGGAIGGVLQDRVDEVYGRRNRVNRKFRDESRAQGPQLDNDDELRFSGENFYSSFSKTLPCDNFGEVQPSAFVAMRRALRTGDAGDFSNIPLATGALRRLANPQAAFKIDATGIDSHSTRIRSSLAFSSPDIAVQLAEVYWQAILRDVPFADYESSNLVSQAVQDLNRFSASLDPDRHRTVTAQNLFRGITPGEEVGPYLSQFLWHSFKIATIPVEQEYRGARAGVDYMTSELDWLAVQRGADPKARPSRTRRRYINDSRMLADYVHFDISFQAFANAALILLDHGPQSIDRSNPYITNEISNQESFVTLGAPFILDMVTRAGNLALASAWFHKWRINRFLRPEAFGARVHFLRTGQRTHYDIHEELLNSAALDRVFSSNGTYLLPQAYPEGSPTHPSFPAGHATVAGACVTVLKALFNEDYVFPNPVVSTRLGNRLRPYSGSLRVGGELNKLASNIALGRDAAGVHYRQDGTEGMRLGEAVAIGLLREQSIMLHEQEFSGFGFTDFSGKRVDIVNGQVIR